MILELYMLFDRVSQAYCSVIYQFKNVDVCKRTMPIIFNNPQFELKPFVNDLQLFRLGVLDVGTGKITSDVKFIANCIDFVKGDDKNANKV